MQAPGSSLKLLLRVKYFIDPHRLIEKTSGCKIHKSKSNLSSHALSFVHKFITGKNLNNVHYSLVDAQSQVEIALSELFRQV